MRAASSGRPRIIARPALATIEASAMRADRTVASSVSLVQPRAPKLWRCLMYVGKKLRFVLNARCRMTRCRSRRAPSWPTAGHAQMKYTVVMIPSAMRTRVLLSHGPDELLRAVLPPPSQVRHERSTITFLEGLAMWLDAKLHVVLSVDAKEAGFCLGLTNEMGVGIGSVYFDVEVHDRRARRRRGQRIRGIGDFADLRQLRMLWLIPDGN
jgi:hypothetical protein